MAGGRPRTFDEHEVLDRAMQLFWQMGYGAVGLRELCDHLKVSRQSLYNTFGSKRGLLVRCIEHYRDTQLAQALAMLADDARTPLDRVRDVAGFFEGLALDARCRGCFVANLLVELGPHDQEVGALLGGILEVLREGMERTLVEAQQAGDLSVGKDPVQLSRALTNAFIGLAVSGKLELPEPYVRDIYSGTLSMLV